MHVGHHPWWQLTVSRHIELCFIYQHNVSRYLFKMKHLCVRVRRGSDVYVCACAYVIMAKPHTWRHSICGSIACVCVGTTEALLVHCYPKGSIKWLPALRCKYLNLNYRASDLSEQCGRWAPQIRQKLLRASPYWRNMCSALHRRAKHAATLSLLVRWGEKKWPAWNEIEFNKYSTWTSWSCLHSRWRQTIVFSPFTWARAYH